MARGLHAHRTTSSCERHTTFWAAIDGLDADRARPERRPLPARVAGLHARATCAAPTTPPGWIGQRRRAAGACSPTRSAPTATSSSAASSTCCCRSTRYVSGDRELGRAVRGERLPWTARFDVDAPPDRRVHQRAVGATAAGAALREHEDLAVLRERRRASASSSTTRRTARAATASTTTGSSSPRSTTWAATRRGDLEWFAALLRSARASTARSRTRPRRRGALPTLRTCCRRTASSANCSTARRSPLGGAAEQAAGSGARIARFPRAFTLGYLHRPRVRRPRRPRAA